MGIKEDFLRTRIEEMRLSQADISRKTDIPPGTISSILRSEDGIEKTSYGNVRKICEVLGVDVDDLERVGPDGRLPERTGQGGSGLRCDPALRSPDLPDLHAGGVRAP